ncbi:hypothetical protein HJC23_004694 [Cyclotella cryptica]|uniref:RING-type domain-containing protein n=1 Tax=Cyclotella cryptica TaxID=29204 RepID=A0ABD3PKH0_9STRA|eukprot:CCRYP_013923-RA/>CCRYP_013923-RA protein AED:0.03 eAED:0.03 QI:431/1/1/1/0/0/3/128/336
MSDENIIKIDFPVKVLIICVLIVQFFIFPICLVCINHMIQKLCRCIGCNGCGCGSSDAIEEIDIESPRHTPYILLSSGQKTKIERLRNETLKKFLERYSICLTLGQNTLMIKEDNDDDCHLEGKVGADKSKDGLLSHDKLQVQTTKESAGKETVSVENSFTHILIPHPGYDQNSVHVSAFACIKRQKNSRSTGRNSIGSVPTFLRGEETKHTEQPLEINNAIELKDTRTVAKFCAICLASYELNESVSWSSNEACTHVFHTECILTWLSSLGKKWSRSQQFSDYPEWDELLGYSLECPCCRQDFVSNLVCACCDEQNRKDDWTCDQLSSRVLVESA